MTVRQIKCPATVLASVPLRTAREEKLGSLVVVLVKACLELALHVFRQTFVVVVSIIQDRG